MKNQTSKKHINALKKAIDENSENLTEENLLLVLKLFDLKETLANIKKYEVIGIPSIVEKNKRKLKSFEGFLDIKYWNDFALFYMGMAITCGVVDSLEEAIVAYEEFK